MNESREELLRDILFDLSKSHYTDDQKLVLLGSLLHLFTPELSEDDLRFYLQLSGVDVDYEMTRRSIAMWAGAELIKITDLFENSLLDKELFEFFFGSHDPDIIAIVKRTKASADNMRNEIDSQ